MLCCAVLCCDVRVACSAGLLQSVPPAKVSNIGNVKVTIIEAVELPKMDKNGLIDAYCKVVMYMDMYMYMYIYVYVCVYVYVYVYAYAYVCVYAYVYVYMYMYKYIYMYMYKYMYMYIYVYLYTCISQTHLNRNVWFHLGLLEVTVRVLNLTPECPHLI